MLSRLILSGSLGGGAIGLAVWGYWLGTDFWWLYFVCAVSLVWSLFIFFERSFIQTIEWGIVWCVIWGLDFTSWIKGYRVYVADASEAEEIYRLRYDVYKEAGYVGPDEHPVFTDSYDPFSSNVVVRKRGKLVATIRVIFFNTKANLSTFSYYNVGPLGCDNFQLVELGRWVSRKEYRKSSARNADVTILLILKMYTYLLTQRKQYIVVTLKEKLRQHLESIFGIRFSFPDLLPLSLHQRQGRMEIAGYFSPGSVVEVCTLPININDLLRYFFNINKNAILYLSRRSHR